MKYITVTLLFAFFSCTYPCAPSQGLSMELVGFTQQEADTIILKKYEKGKGFAAQIDSLLIDENTTHFTLSHDTLRVTSGIATMNLLSKYDYIIRIPSTNSVFYITEMNEPQQEGRKSRYKVMCGNSIQSCKINGAATQIRHDYLYLKK